jgi:hypothetical protein
MTSRKPSPEFVAELMRELLPDPPPPPAPKVPPRPGPEERRAKVVVDHGEVVRNADVRVSPVDPNARHRGEERVVVRRPGIVTIDMAAAERQYWHRVHEREMERQQRRALDPFGYGHWGRFDD